MRRALFTMVIVSVLCLAVVPAHATGALDVFVSILPQKYLLERIGGEQVRVQVMVKPGLNPETYEPTPRQMAALSRADLYFRIAVPFEEIWIGKIHDQNPMLKIIECCAELTITDPPPYDPVTGTESNIGVDAHVWTSPHNARVLARIVLEALTEADPEHAENYQVNFHRLIMDLDELDHFIQETLSEVDNRYLLVAHPSWGHFAAQYGLTQIAIERHGTEARARQLAHLIEFAKSERIQYIYLQKQFDSPAARMLADAIEAKLIELDPLAENYIENLRQVALSIANAENQP